MAERASESAESRVTCYAGIRLLSRYFGRAVAGVGLATRFIRPNDPLPGLEEESSRLAESFKGGIQEVVGPQRRGDD